MTVHWAAESMTLGDLAGQPDLFDMVFGNFREMCMNVMMTATGAKIGSKGHVANTPDKMGTLLGLLTKGEARQVRKQLRTKGLNALAAARRAA